MKIGKDYIGVGVGAFIVNENNEVLLHKRAVPAEKRPLVYTWWKTRNV